mgnify:CR=1 FL=1
MQDIEKIYKNYSRIVYKYIFCLTANEDIAEEIVQETFLVAVKDINKFKGECKISTWLCQIAKYIWYKKLKKIKSSKEISIDKMQNEILQEDYLENIEDKICDNESKFEILKSIQKLDNDTKNVMYLRLFRKLKL